MRHYVKVVNGSVVSQPKEMSSNPGDSPNVFWKLEQMKINGFFEVDISHDNETEDIDIANPVINEVGVFYNKLRKQASEILSLKKQKMIKLAKIDLIFSITKKFSHEDILLVALGVMEIPSLKTDIQSLVDKFESYKERVETAQDLTALEGIEK